MVRDAQPYYSSSDPKCTRRLFSKTVRPSKNPEIGTPAHGPSARQHPLLPAKTFPFSPSIDEIIRIVCRMHTQCTRNIHAMYTRPIKRVSHSLTREAYYYYVINTASFRVCGNTFSTLKLHTHIPDEIINCKSYDFPMQHRLDFSRVIYYCADEIQDRWYKKKKNSNWSLINGFNIIFCYMDAAESTRFL